MDAEPVGLAVEPATLASVVRAALGAPDAEVLDWRVEPLGGGMGAILGWSALRRVAGTARRGSESLPWGVVLKAFRPGAGPDDPAGSFYWQREPLVYRSGVLADLPSGLRAPRLLGAEDRPDGEVWLWLEEVPDLAGPEWPLERYGLAARHLGRFNGAYLVDRLLPADPWLPAGYLRRWVDRSSVAETALPAVRTDPEMGKYWPEDVLARTLALWARRGELYAALERLPRTFCHGDATRGNLLAAGAPDGQAETVALDWAFAGLGAPGEEIAQLVVVSVLFGRVELGRLRELEETVHGGYVQGLRDAGWRGDERQVRLGYAAHAALRNSFLAPGIVMPPPAQRAAFEAVVHRPYAEFLELWTDLRRYKLDRADEAWALAAAM
jgi:hypothetical protein